MESLLRLWLGQRVMSEVVQQISSSSPGLTVCDVMLMDQGRAWLWHPGAVFRI